jgi:hypothetical protein
LTALLSFERSSPGPGLTFTRSGTRTRSRSSSAGGWIVHGIDLAAPLKMITVKEGSLPLYLRPDTLALMAKRDSLGRGPRYKAVRNMVTAMVR